MKVLEACLFGVITFSGFTYGASVSLMTYNVENLFDTYDDPGKSDETFLPLVKKSGIEHQKKCARIHRTKWREHCLHFDWSEKVLEVKLRRIGEVIQSYQTGKGPDVLVLQEVENQNVLSMLFKKHLEPIGFRKQVLLEGKDIRGIDVAVVSKLQLLSEPILHTIPFKGMTRAQLEDSRGLLETRWRLPKGGVLIVLAAHFPAPFHPRKFREQALRYINEMALKFPKDSVIVLMGDLNIPKEEDESFHLSEILEKQGWLWAHRVACEECRGTTYYPPKQSWSFLDRIALKTGSQWGFKTKSAHVLNLLPIQSDTQGHPSAFFPPDTGVSDHFPLIVELEEK